MRNVCLQIEILNYTVSFIRKFLQENEPQKFQCLNKTFRKFPATNAWAAVFKKMLIFSRALQKLNNWVNFDIFSFLKLFSVFIINVIPSSLVNMDRLKDGNVELCRFFVVINKFQM